MHETNAQTQPAPNTTLWWLTQNAIECTTIGSRMFGCTMRPVRVYVYLYVHWMLVIVVYAVAKLMCARRKEFEKRIRRDFLARSGYVRRCCCTVVVCILFFVFFFCWWEKKNTEHTSTHKTVFTRFSSLFAFVRRLLFIHWFSSHRYFSSFSRSQLTENHYTQCFCLVRFVYIFRARS